MTQIQGLLYLYIGITIALALAGLVFLVVQRTRKELRAVLPDDFKLIDRKRFVLLVVLLLVLYVVPIVAPSKDLILEANADIEGKN